jgi:hypothetical protein
MNPEQQRIAIAEACGYVKQNDDTDDTFWWIHSADGDEFPYSIIGDLQLPNYLNDLNAMHEAEKVLDDSQLIAMDEYLSRIFKPKPGFKLLWQATAAQRAEAFLRTLGKWVES